MNNDVKTEGQILNDLKSFIKAKVEQLKSATDILMKEKGTKSSETINKIIELQVYIYISTMIKSCKNFNDLANIKKNIIKSATNFREKFSKMSDEYEGYSKSHSPEEIKAYILEMKTTAVKHNTLKQVFLIVKETLKMPAIKERVNVNSAPKVTQVPTKERALDMPQTTISVSDVEKALESINKRIYDLKLARKRINPSNEEQLTRSNIKVMEAMKIREDVISKLVDPSEVFTELQSVSSAEEAAASSYGRTPRKPYKLDIAKFIPAFEQLNRMISDLKINGVKSETFRRIHAEDHKTDLATYSRDLSKYSSIRDDMILAAVEGRSDLKDIKKSMLQISSLEHTYNLEGGFAAFKKRGGNVVQNPKTRDMYKRGIDALTSEYRFISSIVEEELSKKGSVTVVDRDSTYEELNARRESAYKALNKAIIWRISQNSKSNSQVSDDAPSM